MKINKMSINEDSTVINGEYIIYHDNPYKLFDIKTAKPCRRDGLISFNALKNFIESIKLK